MSQAEGARVAAAADEDSSGAIGTAFSRLRRRTSSIPIDPPIARTDVRRDLLLAVVEEADGLLSVNGAAAGLAMERTAVSRLVAACVENGLVERVASQTDGRSITLRLTRDARPCGAHATSSARPSTTSPGLVQARSGRVRSTASPVRRRYGVIAGSRRRVLTALAGHGLRLLPPGPPPKAPEGQGAATPGLLSKELSAPLRLPRRSVEGAAPTCQRLTCSIACMITAATCSGWTPSPGGMHRHLGDRSRRRARP